jgi:hypothetical protein
MYIYDRNGEWNEVKAAHAISRKPFKRTLRWDDVKNMEIVLTMGHLPTQAEESEGEEA